MVSLALVNLVLAARQPPWVRSIDRRPPSPPPSPSPSPPLQPWTWPSSPYEMPHHEKDAAQLESLLQAATARPTGPAGILRPPTEVDVVISGGGLKARTATRTLLLALSCVRDSAAAGSCGSRATS